MGDGLGMHGGEVGIGCFDLAQVDQHHGDIIAIQHDRRLKADCLVDGRGRFLKHAALREAQPQIVEHGCFLGECLGRRFVQPRGLFEFAGVDPQSSPADQCGQIFGIFSQRQAIVFGGFAGQLANLAEPGHGDVQLGARLGLAGERRGIVGRRVVWFGRQRARDRCQAVLHLVREVGPGARLLTGANTRAEQQRKRDSCGPVEDLGHPTPRWWESASLWA